MRYRDRLRYLILTVLLCVYLLTGTLLIACSFTAQLSRETEAAQSEHRMVLYSLLAVGRGAEEARVDLLLGQAAQTLAQDGRGLCLYDAAQETVLYHTGQALPRDEWLLSEPTTARQAVSVCRTAPGRYAVRTGGAFALGERTIYVECTRDISAVYAARSVLLRIFAAALPVVVLVGLAAASLLARGLTRPLTELADAARRLAAGELDSRAPVSDTSEFNQLAGEFNKMAEQLQGNIAALQDSVRRQEDFIASFAHELRTPLTSLIGYADLLRSQSLTDETRQTAAQYIFTEGKRLENLSVKLLDLIVLDKQKLARVPCRMARLIADAGGVMHPLLREQNISLVCRPDDTVWPVDPDLIKTLLINLIDNARKAMPEGGLIALKCDRTDDGLRILVRDTGRGIPPEELPRLTEAFYRVDKARARAQGGVGLGLTLCARIAALHGGTISIASTPGQGTTVTVLLGKEDAA